MRKLRLFRLNSARRSLSPLVFKTVHATFAAHGSSVERSLVMSPSLLGEFVKSTVYLVMTVTMNHHQVAIPVVRPSAIAVMECDQVFRRAEESARLAVPCLVLQQRREAPRHTWVCAPSCRPIAPVAVVRAR